MLANTFSLAGKTVLVTGASSGLGAHFARLAQAAGARVVLAARRVERLQVLAEALQANGGEAFAVALDVTCRDSVEQAFDQAQARFGVVDVVINNAGIGDPGRFLDLSGQDWQRMLSTNLDGVFHVAQCAAQRLVKAGQPGSIVNIASILGLRVGSGLSHYCTAKAAVVQLTKAMALEAGPLPDPRQCHCPRLLQDRDERGLLRQRGWPGLHQGPGADAPPGAIARTGRPFSIAGQ